MKNNDLLHIFLVFVGCFTISTLASQVGLTLLALSFIAGFVNERSLDEYEDVKAEYNGPSDGRTRNEDTDRLYVKLLAMWKRIKYSMIAERVITFSATILIVIGMWVK